MEIKYISRKLFLENLDRLFPRCHFSGGIYCFSFISEKTVQRRCQCVPFLIWTEIHSCDIIHKTSVSSFPYILLTF